MNFLKLLVSRDSQIFKIFKILCQKFRWELEIQGREISRSSREDFKFIKRKIIENKKIIRTFWKKLKRKFPTITLISFSYLIPICKPVPESKKKKIMFNKNFLFFFIYLHCLFIHHHNNQYISLTQEYIRRVDILCSM